MNLDEYDNLMRQQRQVANQARALRHKATRRQRQADQLWRAAQSEWNRWWAHSMACMVTRRKD